MSRFRIEGGHPLKGTIRASGNKNAALPIIASSLLGDGPLTIRNLPQIGDVKTMLSLIENMGGKLTWLDEHAVTIDNSNIKSISSLPLELCRKVRGSILLAGPLLHRFGEVRLPFPGGDRIGRRRLDTHLIAMQQMGAQVEAVDDIHITAPKRLMGVDLLLDEASVTATENTIMAAALAKGTTIIGNAACEPHVQELCRSLIARGARIDGVGSNELKIHGVDNLGPAEITLGADYIEVGSLIILAAVTGGDVIIEDASPDNLRMILFNLARLGIEVEFVGANSLRVAPGQKLEVRPDYRGAIPKIDDSPWPGFPADLTSVTTVAATQAKGSVIIFEKMFESRMFFVDQLIEMGAQIVLCDPHRAVVVGPNKLLGSKMNSPDIRAGMALLIASLCAEGESTIDNIVQIDRGYERIDERLRALGARIERQDG
ncbi:MAG: UDP-N-acetylglucosamine 1-carboxyvinyltransferase [Planctomycetes bacterium]|nr:UDP-N-acetylglucosamine 1-carboxyvinyltransferase [Planctomycetota bacterium]